MTYQTLTTQRAAQVATVVLNRSQVRNAFNETMIAEITHSFPGTEQCR